MSIDCCGWQAEPRVHLSIMWLREFFFFLSLLKFNAFFETAASVGMATGSEHVPVFCRVHVCDLRLCCCSCVFTPRCLKMAPTSIFTHNITIPIMPPIAAVRPPPFDDDAGERPGGTPYEPRRRRVGREGDRAADQDAAVGQPRWGRQDLEMSAQQHRCGVCRHAVPMTPTAVGRHVSPRLLVAVACVSCRCVEVKLACLWEAGALFVTT